jgi:hypothetical protein
MKLVSMNALCSGTQATVLEGCFGVAQIAELAVAILFGLTLIVLPITLLITLGLVGLFRARVKRSMRAGEGASVNSGMNQRTPNGPPGKLNVAVLRIGEERGRAARATPLLAQLRQHARGVALTYAVAVCVQPLVLAAVFVAQVHFAPTNNVSLKFVLLYISFFLLNATPVVLAPTIVLARRLLFLIPAVLALSVVLWAFDRVVGGDLLGMWLQTAGVGACAVLLLNTWRLRAVGPIVFAAALLFAYGAAGGVVGGGVLGWNAIGPVHFVREDLNKLPLSEGMNKYVHEILMRPAPEIVAELSAFASKPMSVLKPAHPEALTTKVGLRVIGVTLAGIVLGAVASFAFVRWLAVYYRTRRASDQMLSVDVLVAIFTLSSLLTLSAAFGWVVGACTIPAYAAYSLCAHYGLQWRRRTAFLVEPRTLLLLRVFGFGRRTQRLLQQLGQQWRYLGPIWLIGGVDSANSTIEPHEFFEFLNGRLTRAFVRNRHDLDERLRENVPSPDPDGLFRIEDFYCFENTWRMTVSHVAAKADAVLMDLRGFSPSNRGCIFEIGQLIACVSVPRIVLLIDRTTDLSFLERTLHDAWRTMPSDSPNCLTGDHQLRLVLASSRHRRTLEAVTGLLCES